MEETALRIRVFGEPGLKKGVKRLKKITDYHRKLLSQMAQVMYEVKGVGLAAPQIGVNESLFVADTGTSGLYKLINPKIVQQEGTQSMEEGCLSVPGIAVKVKRAKKITLSAQDEFGKAVVLEAEDLLARVFQHEIDHLNGTLIVDHAPLWERLRMKKKLEKIKKSRADA